jgi:hypothetical protein
MGSAVGAEVMGAAGGGAVVAGIVEAVAGGGTSVD